MLKNPVIRKLLLSSWLIGIFSVIAIIFWHNEWVYSLPTPEPVNYKAPDQGDHVNIKYALTADYSKPVFLHFFNPACPCSRFNIKHVRSLINAFGDKCTFAVVVLAKEKYTEAEIQEKFGHPIPVLFDESIARTCGVYSTPQAVILDTDQKLYYRGNYNKSRYCADPKSDYAKMALDSLLNHTSTPSFDSYALKAYGCELPSCNK